MARTMAAALVLTTVGSGAAARRLARALVEEKLAACVQIVPRVRSVYRWKGKIEEATEWLLLVKTTKRARGPLMAWLAAHHPYDTPEILAVDSDAGVARYLEWLTSNVTSRAR